MWEVTKYLIVLGEGEVIAPAEITAGQDCIVSRLEPVDLGLDLLKSICKC